MRHRKKKVTLDRKTGPRGLLLRSLAVSMLLHEHVQTTAAKARAVRPLVERCITIGKGGTLTDRRHLLALLAHRPTVAKLMEVLGPKYRERPGGYTRTIRLGRRLGDAAETVRLELV